MIRPSLLPIARHCGYAVKLAEESMGSSSAAEAGTAFHAVMADHIRGVKHNARCASMFATLPKHVKAEAEVPVSLEDFDV